MNARAAETPLPDAIAAPGETVVLTLHAEGAQVYDCKAGSDGKSAWAFREPIATLMARRQDRRPALCRAELGAHRRQRRGRQSRRQRTRCDAKRHSLAEARSDLRGTATASSPASRQCSGSTHQAASSTAPATRQAAQAQRALLRRLRIPAQGLNAAQSGGAHRRRQSMIRKSGYRFSLATNAKRLLRRSCSNKKIERHASRAAPAQSRATNKNRSHLDRGYASAIAFSIADSAASALAPSGPPACAMSGRPPPPLPPSASERLAHQIDRVEARR